MRTIQLTPSQNKIKRNYLRGEEVFCICDTSLASFTVMLPDLEGVEDVIFNLINVGSKILTVSCLTRQNMSGLSYFTLKQWDSVRLIIDSAVSRYLIVDKKTNRFGSETDYTEFETDGSMTEYGKATTFDDMNGSALSLEQVGTGVSRNTTENTVEFNTASNLSDYLFDNYQLKHQWLPGSVLQPHFHWKQAQNNLPNFLIRYRWQKNGGLVTTSWTDYICKTPVFTYTSGTLNQISKNGGITPPVDYSISDILEIRAYRDNANSSLAFSGADPYTATVGVSFIDIHIEQNKQGSRTEYSY